MSYSGRILFSAATLGACLGAGCTPDAPDFGPQVDSSAPRDDSTAADGAKLQPTTQEDSLRGANDNLASDGGSSGSELPVGQGGALESGDLDPEKQPPGTQECGPGQHACLGLGCVANDDPQACGTSCVPCVAPDGGQVDCDGTRCVSSCAEGMQLCAGTCIDAAAPCDGTCEGNQNLCGGTCADDSDPNNCGAECAACPLPNGAASTACVSGVCDFTCPSGAHRCDGACASDSDPEACGADCVQCPEDPHGSAVCLTGSCVMECDPGFHTCNGMCVADDSTTACGESCEPCQSPSGGSVACNEGICVPSCPSDMQLCAGTCIGNDAACDGQCETGKHDCGGNCVPNDSAATCGDRCTPCPSPAQGGRAVCSSGSCQVQCDAGFHLCSGECVSNGATASCGGSCSPCAAPKGGTVSCDGNSCQPSCPVNARLCDQECLDNTYACGTACPADSHECSGRCFSDNLGLTCDVLRISGASDLGTTSGTSTTLTIFNAAPYAVNGLSVALGSTAANGCSTSPANMWTVSDSTCSTYLGAGSACTVTVRFDPSVGASNVSCYSANLAASGDGNTAIKVLSAKPEAGSTGYTWQIKLNSNSFTYDNTAPVVGSSCSTPGEVRDARSTEISYTRRFTYNFKTNPPSQGTCQADKVAVASCEYYQGPSCDALELKAGSCAITCTTDTVADTGCQYIYRQIICQ